MKSSCCQALQLIIGYTRWFAHGELKFSTPHSEINDQNDMHNLLCDVYGGVDNDDDVMDEFGTQENEEPNATAAKFYKFLEDSQQELYPSCKKFSKLYFLIRMLHIKCLGKWTDKSFTMMIELLNEAFSKGVQLPKSWYDVKKVINELDVETRFNQIGRNDISDETPGEGLHMFSWRGRPIGKAEVVKLDTKALSQAHRYVLFNCKDVDAYVQKHKDLVTSQHHSFSERQIQRIHNETFPTWFQEHVAGMHLDNDDILTGDLKLLARGPNAIGKKYKGFIVNGFRFHTKDREKNSVTQNSRLMVSTMTTSFTSSSDRNPVIGEVSYYGVINGIIELNYSREKKVVVFDCDWVSKGKRLKQNDDGFTLTNFTNVKRHNEPFILASQAQQVFYVEDPIDSNWQVVMKSIARDQYDMVEEPENEEFEQVPSPEFDPSEDFSWARNDVIGTKVDLSMATITAMLERKKEMDRQKKQA